MVDVPGEDPKFGKGSHDEVLFLGVGRLKALRMAFLTQPSKRGIPRSDRAIRSKGVISVKDVFRFLWVL